MKKLFALISASIILISCGGKEATTYASPIQLQPSPEKGLAIGTITFEGDIPVNEIYRFFYEATSGDKSFKKENAGKIMIITRQKEQRGWKGDFDDTKTYLVVIEREAGNYAFTNYTYLNRLGPTGEVSYSDTFAIPFEIKKGGITYFGNLNYVDKVVKGEPRIFVADYFGKDLPQFEKKYPTINWNNTENQTPKKGDTGKGLVDFRF
ncbi:hypothetical protein ACLI1A_05950 [Flavobacterium sp. RHBU_3]|uniref:hypothetical protein n=1 Tax=Flavobacterium sp. RHBU_3 TaxID=3391184 RepID=UPI0039852DC2